MASLRPPMEHYTLFSSLPNDHISRGVHLPSFTLAIREMKQSYTVCYMRKYRLVVFAGNPTRHPQDSKSMLHTHGKIGTGNPQRP